MREFPRAWTVIALVLVVRLAVANPSKPTITTAPTLISRQQVIFEPGNVGVKPLPKESLKAANIEGHTKYLTEIDGTTSWKGPDASWVSVETKTATRPDKAVVTGVVNHGITVTKNANGGLDILFSPRIKQKLEQVAKNVKACPLAGAKRSPHLGKRQGSRCAQALEDYLNQVGEDSDLRSALDDYTHQLNPDSTPKDPTHNLDEDGPPSRPSEQNGPPTDDTDSGYGSGSETESEHGYSEGVENDGMLETTGTITAEEGEAISGVLAGGAEAELSLEAAGSIAAGALLAAIWDAVSTGTLDFLVSIPPEKVNKVKKPKKQGDDEQATTTSTSSSACASFTELPECGAGCKPTTTILNPKATNIVDYACSEGKRKGCQCNPPVDSFTSFGNLDTQIAIFAALDAAKSGSPAPDENKPKPSCQLPRSFVASRYFGPISQSFCKNNFQRNADSGGGGLIFDIFGNAVPHRARRDTFKFLPTSPPPLTPPISLQTRRISNHNNKRSSPEAGPETYANYRFSLQWKPNPDTKKRCLLPDDDPIAMCQSAFDTLQNESPCGKNHGSPIDRLFVDASLDIGCGTIYWHVLSPNDPGLSQPPKISPQMCYKPYYHADVHEGTMSDGAKEVCRDELAGQTFNKDSEQQFYHFNPVDLSVTKSNYHFSVQWVEGCTETKEQSLEFPADSEAMENKDVTCRDLMYNNWKDCNNQGGGGWKQVGCVRYEFWAGKAPKENRDVL